MLLKICCQVVKAFDSVWHPTLFHKFNSTGLASCLLVRLNFFLTAHISVFLNHKSCFFHVC